MSYSPSFFISPNNRLLFFFFFVLVRFRRRHAAFCYLNNFTGGSIRTRSRPPVAAYHSLVYQTTTTGVFGKVQTPSSPVVIQCVRVPSFTRSSGHEKKRPQMNVHSRNTFCNEYLPRDENEHFALTSSLDLLSPRLNGSRQFCRHINYY